MGIGWRVVFHRRTEKELLLLKRAGLKRTAKAIVDLLAEDPFRNPPPYEKLCGDLRGLYSRRINRKHRIVYAVDEEARQVRVLSMWSHYEGV